MYCLLEETLATHLNETEYYSELPERTLLNQKVQIGIITYLKLQNVNKQIYRL